MYNGMTHLPRPGIPVTGRSRLRIGKAPGGYEVVLRGDFGSAFEDDLFYCAAQVRNRTYPAVGEHTDPTLFHEPDKEFLHISCPVCLREYSATPFNLGSQVVFMKEIDRLINAESGQGTQEEFAVLAEDVSKLPDVGLCVGYVAPVFAGHEQFYPGDAVFLQENDAGPTL